MNDHLCGVVITNRLVFVNEILSDVFGVIMIYIMCKYNLKLVLKHKFLRAAFKATLCKSTTIKYYFNKTKLSTRWF